MSPSVTVIGTSPVESLALLKQSLVVKQGVVLPSEDDTEEALESEFLYDDNDFIEAMGLLKDAMQTLGFYGERNLSGTIVKHDRERMLKLAEKILQFTASVSVEQE